MNRRACRAATLLIVVLAGSAWALVPQVSGKAAQRKGFALEFRYEPIPGVPLAKAKTAPLPVSTLESARAAQAVPSAGYALPEHTGAAGCISACQVIAARQAGLAVMDDPAQAGDGPPNLLFYAPTGWDYPIVPSNVRGTHTVGPDLNDGDSTFFDFAVANNGSSTAQPRFYTYLYNDGSVFAGFYTESLPAGYYTYYEDYGWLMPSGSHTIAGFTDSTNVIAESLETDNRWSRSYTWRATGGALANLKPYAPTGWDFPIVPSDVRGTNTVGPDLNDLDTTFIDIAFINEGNVTAKPRFYTYLYVDGKVQTGWYIDSLIQNQYGFAEDDENMIPAGTHTLETFVDSFNAVQESNEGDNRWSHSWAWRHDPAALPNLTYYQPDTSWEFPLVPSSVRGTHHAGPNLTDADTTFVDWCIANLGNYVAKPTFYVYLYFETTPFAGWYMESLPAHTYNYLEDDEWLFPSGTHSLGMVIDSTATVAESNENDNRWSRQFTWQHVGMPDLAPYQPTGWDFPLVPSNVRGTHTVGPFLNDFDTTFIDFAFANYGGTTAQPTFYTYLYEDGMAFAGFYTDSLPAGFFAQAEDYPWFCVADTHELAMFVDSTDVVAESLENNNRYSHSFYWSPWVGVAEEKRIRVPATLTVERNPAVGDVGVRYQLPADVRAALSAYDAAGKLVRALRVSGSGRANLSGLSSGLYFLVLEPDKGRRHVSTVVKL